MFCKKFLALLLWCHCYHIVLGPFKHLLTFSVDQTHHFYEPNGIFVNRGGLYVAAASADIKTQQTQIALTPGHEISLRCDVDGYPDANFTWFRTRQYPIKFRSSQSDEKIELKPTNDQIIVNNNILVLKSPSYADLGDYFCRVKNGGDLEGQEVTISVRARPYILEFNLDSSTLKSAVVEEGTSLKIPCMVSDDYEPEDSLKVVWYTSKYEEDDMNEVISDDQDGIRVEKLGNINRMLVIDRITKDHRRYYKCHVRNGVTENSKTILIRVKDKYTAIWPAVGILIEIVILIGVIFVVENRKVEPDKEAYDRKAIQM